MSRLGLWALGFPLFAVAAPPLSAQTLPPAQTARPQGKIDIRVDTTPEAGTYENCEEDQDAAIITGEIIVCRRRSDEENRLYDKETAERRHAQRTMNRNEIAAPDVAGDGIFRGPATVSGLCVIPPCPKPPAYMIDFATLPDAPPGSDADRIARGRSLSSRKKCFELFSAVGRRSRARSVARTIKTSSITTRIREMWVNSKNRKKTQAS